MNTVYPYAFANYPETFYGCVVSPTKICMQFENPQIKLRPMEQSIEELPKRPSDNQHYLGVVPQGVTIQRTAVGCQMPVLEEAQLQLIDAYKKYWRLHRETYKATYGKNFMHFILTIYGKLGNLLDEIEKEYDDSRQVKRGD